jgi:hypothetical protein
MGCKCIARWVQVYRQVQLLVVLGAMQAFSGSWASRHLSIRVLTGLWHRQEPWLFTARLL